METLKQVLGYIGHNMPYILGLARQHLMLVGIAVGLAVLIGVPLGMMIIRFRTLATGVLGFATVLLTIPAIALFGLMIPVFSMIGQGIGAVPAISAAFLYSLLPIVRSTYTALTDISPGVREAGLGIGLSSWQRLRWVELPLAVPVIFSGIRTAVILNISVMAIASIIGAGGLGTLILHGISQSDIRMLLTGAVMVSLLAIGMDWVLLQLQGVLTPKGIRK
ncbi:ABC transporter permease [Paludibacterium yongneupense]|uniref:ABC transporter permease n=1 Tax=Paludibacterium yongneupense TaxID=400061 RepID=UPI0003F6F52F|nr:ABC transporter permease [Paludibacterium yongneupense]